MRTDLPLIQLRNGDWVDPRTVRAIIAGSNARPFRTPDGKEFLAYVRVETGQGQIMVPCNDYRGAVQFRDSLARIVNERRAAPVPKGEVTRIQGREIEKVTGAIPEEEFRPVKAGIRASRNGHEVNGHRG